MLNKVFAACLALSAVVVGFLVYYSWSWLQSIGSPVAAVEGYSYYSSLAWTTVWLATLLLFVLANIILARTGKPWPLWATFLFFASFVMALYFWLGISEAAFRRENRLESSGAILGPFFAIAMCLGFGAIVVGNQLLAVRIRDWIYPPPKNEKSPEPRSEVDGEPQKDP